MEKLDLTDDKIFEVICELNDNYGLGLDIENTDHTRLVIDARFILINLIKELEKEQ